ncbi:hypothetical protein [Pluralibacter gergoviae]|uniref:hypothetical protein n=1 Tax=Pluralibacter gergoviae TaxID=61647 RepID=UPI000A73770D|nr:hypothetical protein [Pluralibacter gergoviae]SUB70517.1 Uncharacterised protein [Pluralibacter gergoviae]
MDVEKIKYEWGTEFRCYVDEALTVVVLQSGGTLYYWNDEFSRIMNKEQDIDMIYSPVFGLRFYTEETEDSKKILRDMFLPGLKAQPTIEDYPLLDSEYHHLMYCRDLIQ